MNAVEVKNVSKIFRIAHKKKTTLFESVTSLGEKRTYETIYALKDINFKVKKGETLGIIGLNGSGKTTLLKLIADIIEPSNGTINVNGKISPFLELGVGFQTDLTARENIYLYGAVMGLTRVEIDQRFDKIVKFSGISQFLDTELNNFSSGMYVRLAFSTAIETEADILLFDEVLAVGDARFQKKCMNVFNKLKREGKTIILVSHDLDAIREICDRVILLKKGVIKKVGKPKDVIEFYERHLYSNEERDKELHKVDRMWKEKYNKLSENEHKLKERDKELHKVDRMWDQRCQKLSENEHKLKKEWTKRLWEKERLIKERDKELHKVDRMWDQRCQKLSENEHKLKKEWTKKIRERERLIKERDKELQKVDRTWEKKYDKLSQRMMRLNVIENLDRGKEGSGEIEIINVRLLGNSGNKKNTFRTGEPFIVRIDYNAKKKIVKPVFGVGIHRYDGVHVIGPNTKSHNFSIETVNGKGQVTYNIEHLPLLKGKYLLSVSVHSFNSYKPYDHHNKLYKFSVVGKGGDFGMFYIPAKWSIKRQ